MMSERSDDRARTVRRDRLRKAIFASCEFIGDAGLMALMPDCSSTKAIEKFVTDCELLCLVSDGKRIYPRFQFDLDSRSVLPIMREILHARPDGYTEYQLLAWLLRPHLDFDGPPADALREKPEKILDAFYREIRPRTHG